MSDLSNLTTLAKIREKLSQHDVILDHLRKNHSENIETQKRQKQLLDEKDQKIRDLEKALNKAQHNNSIQARVRISNNFNPNTVGRDSIQVLVISVLIFYSFQFSKCHNLRSLAFFSL